MTATCRYIRLRSITAYDNNTGLYGADFTTCAEINLLDSGDTPLSRSGWTAAADSEETTSESGQASRTIDADNATHWHTRYNPSVDPQPHTLTLDMGSEVTFSKLRWRNRSGGLNGCVGDYEIDCSTNGTDWDLVATGTMQTGTPTQGAEFDITVNAASSTQSYSYTASGGLTLGGVPSELRVRTKEATGGLSFGGTATQVRKVTESISGGLQLSGATPFAKGQTVTVAGGVQLAGSATEIRIRAPAPTGGIILGGSADYSSSGTQTYSYTASGGLTLSGLATQVRKVTELVAGGLQLGGASLATFHESTRTVTTSGGLQLGGTASVSTSSAGATISRLVRDRRRRGFVSTLWGRS